MVSSGLRLLRLHIGAWAPKPYTRTVDMLRIFQLVAFVLGLLFGSFLNVCISRLPQHESIVHAALTCPTAEHLSAGTTTSLSSAGFCFAAAAATASSPFRGAIRWSSSLQVLWFASGCARLYNELHGLLSVLRPDAIHVRSSISPPPRSANVISVAILGFLLIGLIVMDWQTMILPDAFTLAGHRHRTLPRLHPGHLSRPH